LFKLLGDLLSLVVNAGWQELQIGESNDDEDDEPL
jgi:hypothetical protein